MGKKYVVLEAFWGVPKNVCRCYVAPESGPRPQNPSESLFDTLDLLVKWESWNLTTNKYLVI